MKKTLAIIITALGCAAANAQEINAVVARQGNAGQEMVRLTNTPNISLNENGITLKKGETNVESYSFNNGDITVLFASAINSTESTENFTHPAVIENGGKLTVSGTMANPNAQDLVIEDGGQFRFDAGTANAIVEKIITGYNDGNGNWYLVASPISETTPTAVGMIDQTTPANYGLYIFNQSNENGEEWNNYKVQSFNIENQNGYLYARKNGTTLVFDGQLVATAGGKELVFDANAQFKGFNLIGNPYTCDAYINRNFYRMNDEGTELIPASGAIHALEGVFVQATTIGETVTFSKDAPATQNGLCAMTLSQGTATIDRIIVNFGKGGNLDKFMLNESNTKLFIPQNDMDFATIATEAKIGEVPVSFKAAKDGSYTITVNTENVEVKYLHLIDNMTGADIDLLAAASTGSASYSFEAKTSDYASRFKLLFGVKDDTLTGSGSNFVYISNGNLVIKNIEGQATLQIIDVLGRVVSSEVVSGSYNKTLNMKAGVYVINLDGITQKIVVK